MGRAGLLGVLLVVGEGFTAVGGSVVAGRLWCIELKRRDEHSGRKSWWSAQVACDRLL